MKSPMSRLRSRDACPYRLSISRFPVLRFRSSPTPLHARELLRPLPLLMGVNMLIARRRARIAPIPGGHEPLDVGPAVTAHPGRPCVAESVEVDPTQPMRGRLASGCRRHAAGEARG